MKTKSKYRKLPLEQHNIDRLDLLGRLIRIHREEESKLSRLDFAKKHHFNRAVLDKVETGRNITMVTYFRICDALQVSPSELMCME